MRKKILVCFALLSTLLTVSAVLAETSTDYMSAEIAKNKQVIGKKLRSCTPYIYNGDTFIAQVVGYANKKCHYRFYSSDLQMKCEIPANKMKQLSNTNPASVCTSTDERYTIPESDLKVNVFFK